VLPPDIARSAIGWFTAAWTHLHIEDTDDLFMRRRLLIFLLAALAAISMAVPLWAALRSERNLIIDRNGQMQVHHTTRAPRPAAEAATLVFTGIMLLGLASAVRRTS
jgi:hypothetical protein